MIDGLCKQRPKAIGTKIDLSEETLRDFAKGDEDDIIKEKGVDHLDTRSGDNCGACRWHEFLASCGEGGQRCQIVSNRPTARCVGFTGCGWTDGTESSKTITTMGFKS